MSNVMHEMSRYVTGVFEDLVEEYRANMLHEKIDLSRFMVHAQRVEESHPRRRNREAKNARNFEGASSKSRLDI